MKSYKAILFDFDGVLGKTMEDNYKAWAHAFEQHGMKIEKKVYFLLEGLPTMDFAMQILERNGMTSDLASHIVQEKEKHYMNHHSFELYPGVHELIDVLKENGYLLGVVSAGSGKRLLNSESVATYWNRWMSK